MKKFSDLPVYFIIIGLILNIIMFFYNKVSFTSLMIRSIIIIILFAAIGYFVAYALNDAQSALSNSVRQKASNGQGGTNTNSTIDIRVESEDEDELLKITKDSVDEEFAELDISKFKRFMNQDD